MDSDGWTLTNFSTGKSSSDQFHKTAPVCPTRCTEKQCKASMMSPGLAPDARTSEDLLQMAKTFIGEFYASCNKADSPEHVARWQEVVDEVAATGSYELTFAELEFGAKLSWRNASRCIGRIQWNKLKLFDAREVETTRQMFEAICQHIVYSTNDGNIRPAITLFRPRRQGRADFRVWNPLAISYAGYENEDGSVTGDPGAVAFTKVCMRLGWMGRRTKWDILPLVLSSGGAAPDVFDIPDDIVLQVPLTHPTFDWFEELGLRWMALPAVSGMLLDCGGVQFPACPFSGWNVSTKVGCRDLCDPQRYNILETVAAEMGEDTGNEATLWKDRALVEVNVAVLYSYQQQGVTIVDHHTASDNFVQHLENEQKARKGCPADWVWIVPPMSGSLTSVYHQEMALYHLKPSFDHQAPAWKTHAWPQAPTAPCRFSLKQVASVVLVCTGMYRRAMQRRMDMTILYATETGKSQVFANKLATIFAHGLNPKVVCMADYDVDHLSKEALVLVVASTYGNGDAPENGSEFARKLAAMKTILDQTRQSIDVRSEVDGNRIGAEGPRNEGPRPDDKEDAQLKSTDIEGSQTGAKKSEDLRPKGARSEVDSSDNKSSFGDLKSVRYAVFALGSSAFPPNFCAFGFRVDQLFSQLGASKLMDVAVGDEQKGQTKSFRKWFSEIYPLSCKTFSIPVDKSVLESEMSSFETRLTEKSVRFVAARGELLLAAMRKVTRRKVKGCKVLRKTQLHKVGEHSSTILVELGSEERYLPGDHVGVLPENRAELVDGLLRRLDSNLDPGKVVALQLLSEKADGQGSWSPHGLLPACSLRTLLTRFLDVTTPLRPAQLEALLPSATLPEHRQRLQLLATDPVEYEKWVTRRQPTVLEVLQEFPSIQVSPALLATILHPLQPRFYSISSCREAHPGQIHLTVSVVSFRSEGGAGPVHYGVCSNYLNEVPVDQPVYLFVRNGKNFALPLDVSKPVLMVGPGTGIAPFRGFWEQRHLQLKQIANEKAREEFGDMTLFFGCRDREMDLFHDEKMAMVKEGVLDAVYVALSRDPTVPKTYVQHMLAQQGAAVYRSLTERGGHLFVCGDVAMAEGVRKALATIAKQQGYLDLEAADWFIETLKEENRYHEDIFGVTKHSVANEEPPKTPAKPVTSTTPSAKKEPRGLVGRVFCCSSGTVS